MKSALILFAACVVASPCLAARRGRPRRPWRSAPTIRCSARGELTTRDGQCVETWRIDRSGTGLVTSAEEVAETRFTVTDQPSSRGYYKWVDTVVKDNGKKDCGGNITKPPRTATNFILMNPDATRFIVCAAEDGKQCFGPFVKVEGGEI